MNGHLPYWVRCVRAVTVVSECAFVMTEAAIAFTHLFWH